MTKIQEIYIADGHHRAASAVKVGLKRRKEHPDYTGKEEFNYFLSVLFPHDQLMILPYNRVVKDLNGYTPEKFIEKVGEIFDVTHLEPKETASGKTPGQTDVHDRKCGAECQDHHPKQKGQFTMFLAGQWYLCRIRGKDKRDDPVEGLDVSILQKLLLGPVLGIGDPRTDARIDFVGGIRGLSELEHRVRTDCAVAFAMYPTSIQELFAVADAGKLMPPKSTWFEPKLRSGLFIHEI